MSPLVRLPHDAEPARLIALGWPSHSDWAGTVEAARLEIARLAASITAGGKSVESPDVQGGALGAGRGPGSAMAPGVAARALDRGAPLTASLAALGSDAASTDAVIPAAAMDVPPSRPSTATSHNAPPPAVWVVHHLQARPPAPHGADTQGADHNDNADEAAIAAAFARAPWANADDDAPSSVAVEPVAPPPPGRLAAVAGPLADVWLCDTGPIVVLASDRPRARAMRFNGWGGKFMFSGDEQVAAWLACACDLPLDRVDLVGEGGALESDGAGTLITTRAVLLNANRNPSKSQADVDAILADAFGAERVIWLDEGLAHDHTDGHVDMLARFARPGLVVTEAPTGRDDPSRLARDAAARALDGARDARGEPIDVVRIPGAAPVTGLEGETVAASHLNWVVTSTHVLVPVTDPERGRAAVAALAQVFEDRTVVGLPASALNRGGGAFHCASWRLPPGRF